MAVSAGAGVHAAGAGMHAAGVELSSVCSLRWPPSSGALLVEPTWKLQPSEVLGLACQLSVLRLSELECVDTRWAEPLSW